MNCQKHTFSGHCGANMGYFTALPHLGVAAARELVAKRDAWLAGADPGDKKPRTLTRLYNDRPTWLDLAHRALDAAVFVAYGRPWFRTCETAIVIMAETPFRFRLKPVLQTRFRRVCRCL
jgi:hypothetical protein